MIRNDKERQNSEKQVEYLRSKLGELDEAEDTTLTWIMKEDLEMEIGKIEGELDEYRRLKGGDFSTLGVKSLDELGEIIIKARIARSLSQADLAEKLDMEPQQVQRYERNGWQKISLWRLQEVMKALDLHLDLRVRLDEEEVTYGSAYELAGEESMCSLAGAFGMGRSVVVGNTSIGLAHTAASPPTPHPTNIEVYSTAASARAVFDSGRLQRGF